MKKLMILPLLLGSIVAFAQPAPPDMALAKHLKVFTGGTFSKPSILPGADKMAIAQIVVDYKTTSRTEKTGDDRAKISFSGSNRTRYTAMAMSVLEVEGDPISKADYQEITDHFYTYFQAALAKNKIGTVAWDKVKAASFYQDGDASEQGKMDKEGEKSTYVANQGNIMYGGKLGFAFGKIKKANYFAEALGSPVAYIYVTVDFVDMDIDLKAGRKAGWSTSFASSAGSSSATSNTSTLPAMKVLANGGTTLLWNQKSGSESVGVVLDIPAEMEFATDVKQSDEKNKKSKLSFSTQMKSKPVIITTTREKYIPAAKKALERYADAFVAGILKG